MKKTTTGTRTIVPNGLDLTMEKEDFEKVVRNQLAKNLSEEIVNVLENEKYAGLLEEELERLINYIDSGEERLKDTKRVVCKNTIDFNIWYKYSIAEERCCYPSMLGMNTLIGKLINDKLSWLKEKEFRGMVITLDYLLESMVNLYDEGEINKKDIDDIKKEIMRLNFGSVINIW